MSYDIQVQWLYTPRQDEQGLRLLVDRLWPRGRTQAELQVDQWLHDVAPSSALKRLYTNGQITHKHFARRYRDELLLAPQKLDELQQLVKSQAVCLLTAERDLQDSAAHILKETLIHWLTHGMPANQWKPDTPLSADADAPVQATDSVLPQDAGATDAR